MRTALVAVLLFVLQSVLVGFTLGASAAAPALDAFGNPICITGSDASDHPGDHTPGHTRLPDCCTVGCPMLSGPLVAPAGETITLPAPLAVVIDARKFEPLALAWPDRRGHPGRPRGPPAA